jgi:hypothetical protein
LRNHFEPKVKGLEIKRFLSLISSSNDENLYPIALLTWLSGFWQTVSSCFDGFKP